MREYLSASYVVIASFNRPSLQEIDLTSEQVAQFCLHLDQREECRPAVIGERCQDVNVAVGPEVVSYCGPEELELGHPPAAAEGLYGWLVDDDASGHEEIDSTIIALDAERQKPTCWALQKCAPISLNWRTRGVAGLGR